MAENNSSHTIGLFVANKPGVLNRIALIFSRRGYNLDSIVASPARNTDFSHMNIIASGERETLDQILKQLNKLVDVVHAVDYADQNKVEKELGLIKVRCLSENRTDIMQIGHAFRAEVVDISDTTLTFQITGPSRKIDGLEKMLESYTILEVIRTGKVLMAIGEELTAGSGMVGKDSLHITGAKGPGFGD
ncbi:MAG: acetolactate synthase small subunit [Spirochaetales bacterium]|nr:acetolactate synthase small subunit [Spirochaetales bacterium]